MLTKPIITALAVLLGISSTAALATTFPLTLRDDLGRTVLIAKEPKRIISLVPSHTETLFALGAGATVVGRDDYSNAPTEALKLPKLGGLYNPNLEAILALKPDLVLNSEYSSLTPALERAGITVWAGSAQNFEGVFTMITTLGQITSRENNAATLISSMRAEIRSIEALVAKAPKVSVYFEVDPTPYTVGPNSFIGVLLSKAGGTNIVPASLGDFPKISPELVLEANPSVIIGVGLDEAVKRPGWAALQAVQTRRVFALSPEQNDLIARPGPRLAQGLRALAKMLHPSLFP